jgi:hypothetical protein
MDDGLVLALAFFGWLFLFFGCIFLFVWHEEHKWAKEEKEADAELRVLIERASKAMEARISEVDEATARLSQGESQMDARALGGEPQGCTFGVISNVEMEPCPNCGSTDARQKEAEFVPGRAGLTGVTYVDMWCANCNLAR